MIYLDIQISYSDIQMIYLDIQMTFSDIRISYSDIKETYLDILIDRLYDIQSLLFTTPFIYICSSGRRYINHNQS